MYLLIYSQLHKETFEEMMDSFILTKSRSSLPKGRKPFLKTDLLDEVLRFIIKENIPVAKIESPHLKRLLEGRFLKISPFE